jgi:acyl-CoA dehydrogenase
VIGKVNEAKLGIRSWITSELVFDDCAIPLDHRLGYRATAEPQGPSQDTAGQTRSGRSGALGALSQNKANISAIGTGLAQASLDVTAQQLASQRAGWASHRWVTIESELQQMARALDRARRLNLRAQWRQDKQLDYRTEASVAKGYGPPTQERIIRRCMQLLGPEGASRELLLEKWYRDVKILDIFEGSGQVQRVIISRALMGRGAAQA